MKRVHVLLTGLTLTIVLLSINRLTDLTQGHLPPHEFLRWLDFNAMIPIPLLTIVLYVLLLRDVVSSRSIFTREHIALTLLFIVGIYLLGAASGDHEVTNYLHYRFCTPDPGSNLCQIIITNDDGFATDVYYLGVIALNVALMLFELRNPRSPEASTKHLIGVSANALFIGLGVFANLAFEEIGRDLIYFSLLLATALAILLFGRRKAGALPVTYYFAFAYGLGVVGTAIAKVVT